MIAALLVIPALLMGRRRAVALTVALVLMLGIAPDAHVSAPQRVLASVDFTGARGHAVAVPHAVSAQPAPAEGAWRLVIPEIGVDAVIDPVGVDSRRAMLAPPTLDDVAWYGLGPAPGQKGDAVIAGHLGLPALPAVFRFLRLLKPGDTFKVVWPDGHAVAFRVTTLAVMSASSVAPPGLFSRSGPPRLSLVTCAGSWDAAGRTYTERLIVTAVALT
jgi:sortase (surface protein transpeptidase)